MNPINTVLIINILTIFVYSKNTINVKKRIIILAHSAIIFAVFSFVSVRV